MNNRIKISKVRMMAYIGLLTALYIVLSSPVCSIHTATIKIGFTFIPVAIAAILFGPLIAGGVGALGDVLSALLFPVGAWIPGITLNAFLTGFVFGLFLYRKQTWLRALLAAVINNFGISMFLTTLWLSQVYGMAYWPLLVTRIPQCIIVCAVQFLGITAVIKVKAHVVLKRTVARG